MTLLPILILILALARSSWSKALPDLHWDSKNSLFSDFRKTDNYGDSTVIRAELFDELTIECPFYDPSKPDSTLEVSKIYMVSDMAYLNCQLDSSAELFLACDQPFRRKNRKVVFRPYSPLPNGLEFAAGKSYYLISTSNGTESGINSQHHGLCASADLRLRIDVHSTTSSTPAPSSTSPTLSPAALKEIPKEDPVIVYVSEHYNGDDDHQPSRLPYTAKESKESAASVHSRNTRILRTNDDAQGTANSPIAEAYNHQLDLNLFKYVLNMAQNGAVGSVSFQNGAIKKEDEIRKEEVKKNEITSHQENRNFSPKFRKTEIERTRTDSVFTERKNPAIPAPLDYFIQSIDPEQPAEDEPNSAASLLTRNALLVLCAGAILISIVFSC